MRFEDLPLALSVEQVSELLGTKRSATYEAVRNGTLRSFRLGRKIRVPRSALAELLGEELDPSAQEAPALDAKAPAISLRTRTRPSGDPSSSSSVRAHMQDTPGHHPCDVTPKQATGA